MNPRRQPRSSRLASRLIRLVRVRYVGLGLGAGFVLTCAPSAQADDAKRACVTASTDGQTLHKEDKLIEARDKFHVCASDPCPDVVKSRCTRWLAELEPEIPTVIVRATDAAGADVLDAEVSIDGRPISLGRPETLDPGGHAVLVKRANGDTKEDKFLLVDGEHARVLTVRLPKHAADAASTPAPAPATDAGTTDAAAPQSGGGIPAGVWILGAVSLVGFGGFAYFYAQATSEFHKLEQTCPKGCTDAQAQPLHTNADISYVSLGVGIAAFAGAVTWALLPRSSGPAASGKAAATYRPLVDVRPVAGGAMTVVGVSF